VLKIKLSLFLLLCSLPAMVLAITETDFAYTAKLSTANGTPYYELEIPEIVYQQVSRDDLGDMRVFNGAGQVVPHGLRDVTPEKVTQLTTRAVPYFPLYKKVGDSNGDLHLNIQRSASGEVIDIKSSAATPETMEQLSGYLIDLRQWKQPVDKLKFSWQVPKDTSFIRKLNIAISDDLTKWNLISTDKALVNLSYQNYQLVEDDIKLSVPSSNYLRFQFADDKPGVVITGIEVSNAEFTQQQKQNWKQAEVVVNKETVGEYLFQYLLKSSLRKLRIKLPENNTVVNAKVFSRGNETKPWQYRGSALLYRLTVDGVNIQQSELTVSTSRDINWKLQIDQQGGGIGSGLPEIELAWQPQKLVFVARGEPPYKLAWGSAQVIPVTQNASRLLVGVGQGSNNTMLSKAGWLEATVKPVNLTALETPAKPINWRQGLLWAVLIIAAAMLIWMAVRLMKKISAE